MPSKPARLGKVSSVCCLWDELDWLGTDGEPRKITGSKAWGVGTRVDLFERLWLESTRDCWEWGKCIPGTCTPSPGMPLQGCLGLELAPRASYVLAQLSLGLALHQVSNSFSSWWPW